MDISASEPPKDDSPIDGNAADHNDSEDAAAPPSSSTEDVTTPSVTPSAAVAATGAEEPPDKAPDPPPPPPPPEPANHTPPEPESEPDPAAAPTDQLTTCSLEDTPIVYSNYESELQMPEIMRLIQRDLSEPYSIYTYRYFINNWPNLCFLVS